LVRAKKEKEEKGAAVNVETSGSKEQIQAAVDERKVERFIVVLICPVFIGGIMVGPGKIVLGVIRPGCHHFFRCPGLELSDGTFIPMSNIASIKLLPEEGR
jgi:hypothetical protein